MGVSLGGGKTDKSCVAILDYFPEYGKVFLSQIVDRIGPQLDTNPQISGDRVLTEILAHEGHGAELIALDVPLNMPVCIPCRLKCPGYEVCKVKEVAWMRKEHRHRAKRKKPNKMFTPYTERCVEIFLNNGLEESFHLSHALGANAAPLTARAQFLQKHLGNNLIEVAPEVSVWRIGRALRVPKTHLRFHKHSVGGDVSREIILSAICAKNAVFMYQQDIRLMATNSAAFDAFISAFTAYLQFRDQCEARPAGFPARAGWMAFPKEKISW